MACYWGCGTKGNRVAWLLLTGLFMIGASLLAAGVIGNFVGSNSKNCLQEFKDCTEGRSAVLDPFRNWDPMTMPFPNRRKECFKLADQKCKLKLWGSLCLAGLAVMPCSLIVTFFFCCCSRRPSYGVEDMMAVDPMLNKGAVTQAPQGAMFYPPASLPTSVPMQQEVCGPARV